MREYNIVHVINLPERTLRLEGFLKEADRQKFGVKIWDGQIVPHNAKMAINRSHKRIVQYAKDNGLSKICIAEDDCRFFGDQSGAWKYFVDNMPTDFDLYLGMVYVAQVINNRITGTFSGLTIYFVNEQFYDFFLSLPDDVHLDRHLGLTSNIHKYMVCDKFVAEQDGSKSDNSQMTCDYRPYLKGRKIFGDVKID